MSNYIVFEDEDHYLRYCEEHQDRIILVYDDSVYDVTDFLHQHPGGSEIIEEYNSNDVTELLHSAYPHAHSKNAIRTLKKYKIGHLKDDEEEEEKKQSSKHQEPIKIWSYPKVTEYCVEYKEMQLDLQKGLVGQIAKLNKKQYLHVLNNPVAIPNNHLFRNSLLEGILTERWYIAPITWFICETYLAFNSETTWTTDESGLFVLAVLAGIALWTLVEYILQRFVFYGDDCIPDNKYAIALHYILYGKHRMIPSDKSKASVPFPFGFVLLGLLYLVPNLFSNYGYAMSIGLTSGYFCYELLHQQYHYDTIEYSYWKNLQKCHLNHHNLKGKRCYGVTTNLWDKIFRTETE